MTQFENDGFEAEYDAAPQSNPLGVAGFVLSILCVTSPLGLLLSFLALFKNPKGFAIAGTIIGAIFSTLIVLVVILGAALLPVGKPIYYLMRDVTIIQQDFEAYVAANQKIPDELADIGWTGSDPWGNDYLYTKGSEPGTWELATSGPDGVVGTEDDLLIDSEMSMAERDAEIQAWINGQFEHHFSK